MIELEYFGSLRDMTEWLNRKGIKKSEIIQVITPRDDNGYFIMYERKLKKNGDQ